MTKSVAFFALVALLAASPAAAEPLWGAVTVVGQASFVPGWEHDDFGPTPAVMAYELDEAGVTAILAGSCDWNSVESVPPVGGVPQYNWASVDATIDPFMSMDGVTLISGVYLVPPSWLTYGTTEYWQHADRYLRDLIRHLLAKGVDHFIFENEPNMLARPDWADFYMQKLSFAYPIIKAEAPGGVVIAGNLSERAAYGISSSHWWQLFARGFGSCTDVVGDHPYTNYEYTAIDIQELVYLHQIMDTFGVGSKKIFCGEGWGPKREVPGGERKNPWADPWHSEVNSLRNFLTVGHDRLTSWADGFNPNWLYGALFFMANDNWAALHWRDRALPHYDQYGVQDGYTIDGYFVGWNIDPTFTAGGLMTYQGIGKAELLARFPGDRIAVANGGFEHWQESSFDGVATWWSPRTDPPTAGAFDVDDGAYAQGRRSQKVYNPSNRSEHVWYMTPSSSVTAGTSYTVQVWIKTDGVVKYGGHGAALHLQFYTNSLSPVGSETWAGSYSGTHDWTKTEATVVAPSGAQRLHVACYLDYATGTAWFDDVRVAGSARPLRPTATITGAVTGPGGLPVAGARVETDYGRAAALTDASGAYTMTNVRSGFAYTVKASKIWYASDRVFDVAPAAGGTAVVNLALGSTVSAGLINPGFESGFTSGVANGWTKYNVNGPEALYYDGTDQVYEGGHSQKVLTQPPYSYYAHDGVYQIVPADILEDYSIRAWARTHYPGSETNPWDNVMARLGVDPLGGTGFALQGSVDQFSFAEWHDFSVWHDQWLQQSFQILAENNNLTVYLDGWLKWSSSLPSPVWFDAVELYGPVSPDRYGAVTGTVRDEFGARVGGATVVCGGRSGQAAADGSYTIWHVAEGVRDVTASADGYQDATAPGESIGPDHTNVVNFVLLEDPGTVVSTSPPGWLRTGWNLVSAPLEADDMSAPAVWDEVLAAGNVLDNALIRYAGVYEVYPAHFTLLELGRGYWLWLDVAVPESVEGVPREADVGVPLRNGWTMFGHPFPDAVPWSACLVTDGVETKSVSQAESAGWVQGLIYFLDGAGYRTVAPGGGGDDTALRPWRGYWMLAELPGLSLIVPTP